MNMSMMLGMVSGIVVGLLVFFLIAKIMAKPGTKLSKKGAYDERQLRARGEAYKYAFFTLILYVWIVGFLAEMMGVVVLMSFTGMWIGICAAAVVFAVVCILKDAYMTLYENVRGVTVMLAVVSALNLVFAVEKLLDNEPLLENGRIGMNAMNLVAGVSLLIIFVAFIVKIFCNKKAMMEDEE